MSLEVGFGSLRTKCISGFSALGCGSGDKVSTTAVIPEFAAIPVCCDGDGLLALCNCKPNDCSLS